VQCKTCKIILKHNKKSGTTHLGDHLSNAHPDLIKTNEFADLTQAETEEAVVELYIKYNLPRSFVDDPTVIKLITKRCGSYRKLTKDGLDDKVEKLKEFMVDEIKKKTVKYRHRYDIS
jgi:hypothetical protein